MKVIKFIDYYKISITTLNDIFYHSNKYLNMDGVCNDCAGKNMCIGFFQPNYESELQFESAMNKLGGNVIHLDNNHSVSCDVKTFEDHICMANNYCDIIVLSYNSLYSINNMSTKINTPLINAGDEKIFDPVRSLVDMYTIHKHFDIETERLKILFIGDLNNTNIQLFKNLLSLYPNITITHTEECNIEKNTELDNSTGVYNIIYYSHSDKCINQNVLLNEIGTRVDKHSIIMHPPSHNNDIYNNIDKNICSVYSKQVEYGIYVRMSLIYTIMFNNLDNTFDTLEYNYLNQLQSEIHGW